MAQGGEIQRQTESQQVHKRVSRHRHEESLYAPDEDELNQDGGALGYAEQLILNSRANFGLHPPEMREVPNPLTYKEAKRKYRMHEPTMTDYAVKMKKHQLGIARKPSN